jgi:hypothetical protein
MDSRELRSIQEAYMEVVENQQQLDEGYKIYSNRKVQDKMDKLKSKGDLESVGRAGQIRDKLIKRSFSSQIPDKEEKLNRNKSEKYKRSKTVSDNTEKKKSFPNRLTRSDKQGIRDSYDYYDIILSHLLDEGYAETPEAAEAIMVNMSEEWRQSIVEEMLDEELQGKAREKGEELLKKTKGKPNSFQKNSRINWLLGKSKKHPSHEYGTVSRSAEEKGQSRAPKQTKARKGQTKKQGVKTLGGGGGNVGSYGMPQKDTLPRGKGNKAARRAGTYRED